MRVLGIESSCDETAAAVVEDGTKILSNVVNSQIDIHRLYGGVVPEVAARSHLEVVNAVIDQALVNASLSWKDIDAIAVTYGPGLVGSLLIGTLAAKTCAYIFKIPLYKINHIEAHVYANYLTSQIAGPVFPFIALIISGGHTELVNFTDHGNCQIIGTTVDDSVGEVFDKVAKFIGLTYPGGPAISKAAKQGDPRKYVLPIANLKGKYNFSFSGLKTATLRLTQQIAGVDYSYPSFKLANKLSPEQVNDIAASFEYTVSKTLAKKAKLAYEEYQPKSFLLAGGVSANDEIRQHLSDVMSIPIKCPPINLCTDNAAMVASLGYFRSKIDKETSPFELDVCPTLDFN